MSGKQSPWAAGYSSGNASTSACAARQGLGTITWSRTPHTGMASSGRSAFARRAAAAARPGAPPAPAQKGQSREDSALAAPTFLRWHGVPRASVVLTRR